MKRYVMLFSIFIFPLIVCCNVNKSERSLASESKGSVRVTIISDSLVRLEYSPTGQFLNEKTRFAYHRNDSWNQHFADPESKQISISTDFMELKYQDDGQSFNPDNLSIKLPNGFVWRPGTKSGRNLGGTVESLDGAEGPLNLGEGLLSRDGWYLVDDSKGHVLSSGWVKPHEPESHRDWYFFAYGTDYKRALKDLKTISGAVPMPRKYTLGSWYSRYWPYSSDDYRNLVKEYEEHQFPLDVMVLDMDWHKQGWTGWSWNRDLLPDAEDLLQWFHQKRIYSTLNLHPADGVKPHEDQYQDFMVGMGYSPNSQRTVPFDAANKLYIDNLFTHILWPLEAQGVDFWWVDWQQEPYTRGLPGLKNIAWLNQVFYEKSNRNKLRGQSFSRWGGWGDHRYPIHFSGDATTTWKMLDFEVAFNSVSSNVGLFFWSHDMGGHWGPRNEEAYARWVQFGATTAALRVHSTRDENLDKRPWLYPSQVTDSLRRSFHLRSKLFPYLYTEVWKAHKYMLPFNRPMYYEHPQLEKAYQVRSQYFLGDHILVAPIVKPGVGEDKVADQKVWFPPINEGLWFDWFSNKAYRPGTEHNVYHPLSSFPLFVRGGTPIPMQPYTNRMGSDQVTKLDVAVFPGQIGVAGSYTLYEDDGISTGYQEGAHVLTKITYLRIDRETVELVIAPREGAFDAYPIEKNLVIHLMSTLPMEGSLGPIKQLSYDEEKNINTLELGAVNMDVGIKLQLKVRDTINTAP